MTTFLFANFFTATLQSDITAGNTSMDIGSAAAADLPDPSAGEEIRLVLFDGKQAPEIIGVTDNPGSGILTITRAQEGTTARAWPLGTALRNPVTKETLQEVFTAVDGAAPKRLSFKTITAASYSLQLEDEYSEVRMDNAGANSVVVEPDSTTDFPIGALVNVSQIGAGQTTIAAGIGVTILTPDTLNLRKRYSIAGLRKVAANTWEAAGDLAGS